MAFSTLHGASSANDDPVAQETMVSIIEPRVTVLSKVRVAVQSPVSASGPVTRPSRPPQLMPNEFTEAQ